MKVSPAGGAVNARRASRGHIFRRAALLAGGVVAGLTGAGAASAARRPGKLTLYGDGLLARARGRELGELPEEGERITVVGALVDRPGGRRVGDFTSARFRTGPHELSPGIPGDLELHTFVLGGGTLFGVGVSAGSRGRFAVIGGTGRFEGAGGSYEAHQLPFGLGGDGTAEFSIMLTR